MNEDKPKSYRSLAFDSAPRVMVVEARFYGDVCDLLYAGAAEVFEANGITQVERVVVPGALEIPAAVEMGVRSGRFDAYVALGCVIRGGTTHYEIVTEESARGLMDVSINHAIALGNGILTVENKEQAIERADPKQMNKGAGAAQAALEMVALRNRLLGANTTKNFVSTKPKSSYNS